MSTQRLRQHVANLLAPAGITLNGSHPWDIQVHNEQFYKRVLSEGTLGLGESYMEGWWDCAQIDAFACRVLRAGLYQKARIGWRSGVEILLARVLNRQARGIAARNARRHYDLGNRLYELMLDRRMTYSCAYWKNARTLDEAQEHKLELICRKLQLQPGQRVLDIGCGWGSFAAYAAEKYGVRVVGITVSPSQATLAREKCRGLPVEIRLQDYREVREKFDHMVSVGMVEHVGYRNYRLFMQVAARCLQEGGLFLLHTIGHPYSRTSADPFTSTYIFPNCLLPSLKQLGAAMEHLFVLEDLHNFGAYYDPTLMAWFRNFDRHWEELSSQYNERFYRMWQYYLLSSAGSFRARNNQLWQMVLSKKGVMGGYTAVR